VIRWLALAVAMVAYTATAGAAPASVLQKVSVDEHVGERIPLDLAFTSTSARRVELGTLFDGRRPVLMVLTYVRCKMLCSLVLRGAIDAVRAMPLELGRDYRVVMVSIDPGEDVASAAARRADTVAQLGRGPDADWTYLVGAERPIHALADALGFRYTFDRRTEQFAHPAVIFVLTPDGRIARYLHGVRFEPWVLAAALQSAARGEATAGATHEAVLSCFLFDPALRAHRTLIERYLQIGGAIVMGALITLIALLVLWERRRRRRT